MNTGEIAIKAAGRAFSELQNCIYLVPLVAVLLLFQLSCNNPTLSNMGSGSPVPVSVNPNAAVPPEDGQWIMAAKNYANTRFSGLDEINTGNVANLKAAWTFSTGVNRGQEAAPLVIGDTMYVVSPFPNYLYALDLKNAGKLKWKFDPK